MSASPPKSGHAQGRHRCLQSAKNGHSATTAFPLSYYTPGSCFCGGAGSGAIVSCCSCAESSQMRTISAMER